MTNTHYVWVQKVDYENVLLCCRAYFETSHLAKNCPKDAQKNNFRKSQRESTWWGGAKLEHYTILKTKGPLEIKVIETQ